MLLLKNLAFTILVPGTVAGLVLALLGGTLYLACIRDFARLAPQRPEA